jgi:peptide/nickel transport system permease protein
MLAFTIKRLLTMIPVLLFLTAVIFILDHLSPIDPARAQLGPHASPQAINQLHHKLWLDRPLPEQYLHYLDRLLLHGDLGYSSETQQPVVTTLRHALPATIELAVLGLLLATFMALLLGITSAARWRGAGLLRVVMVAAASAPVFLLGVAGILIFYAHLGWLPASGATSYQNTPTGPTGFLLIDSLIAGEPAVFTDSFEHILLPVICVSLIPAVAVGRVLRSSLVTTLSSDYIRTARSKGLTERVILFRHALRNAAGPALAMLGLQAGLMFAGVVVVETVFAWPGIGLITSQAIPVGDFPIIAGVALVIGIFYVVINAVVDILQALADPRIRL